MARSEALYSVGWFGPAPEYLPIEIIEQDKNSITLQIVRWAQGTITLRRNITRNQWELNANLRPRLEGNIKWTVKHSATDISRMFEPGPQELSGISFTRKDYGLKLNHSRIGIVISVNLQLSDKICRAVQQIVNAQQNAQS